MDWPIKKLGEVAEINPKKSEVNGISDLIEVSFIPMQAVDDESGTITDNQVRKLGDVKKGHTYFKSNDVLFAKITPCMQNGKFAIARNLKNGIGFGSTEFHVIRPLDQVLSEWVYLLIRQKSFREEAEKQMTGTAGQQRVPREYLENLEIPVPGIEEQRRIVKKLEKIFDAKKLASEQLSNIDSLFYSVCQTFFKKIEKKLKEVRLNTVCEVVKGKFPTLKTKEGKYPFVVTAEARRSADSFQFDTEAVCVPLVSSTGHGNADIKRIHYQEGKFALANIMAALISKDRNELEPKYLYYYLSFYKDRLLVPLMQGGANVTIPIDSLNFVNILLPPINYQSEIIKNLLRVEKLKKELLEREKLLQELEQSALHQAFQGKL